MALEFGADVILSAAKDLKIRRSGNSTRGAAEVSPLWNPGGEAKQFFVYIMSNNSMTLYIGMTNDLIRRVAEHKAGEIEGFTHRYDVDRLVYFETFDDVRFAIAREKQIKGWIRRKKIDLVKTMNPRWDDLDQSLSRG